MDDKEIEKGFSWSNLIAALSFAISIGTLIYVWGYRDSSVDSGMQKLDMEVSSLDRRVKSLTKYTTESSSLLNELIHAVNLSNDIKTRLIEINSRNRNFVLYAK